MRKRMKLNNKQSPAESRGGMGVGSGGAAVLLCQQVHSGHVELLGNFDGGVGRPC